jgi:hypothetical protein
LRHIKDVTLELDDYEFDRKAHCNQCGRKSKKAKASEMMDDLLDVDLDLGTLRPRDSFNLYEDPKSRTSFGNSLEEISLSPGLDDTSFFVETPVSPIGLSVSPVKSRGSTHSEVQVKAESPSPTALQYTSSDSENADDKRSVCFVSSDPESEYEIRIAEESEDEEDVKSGINAAPVTILIEDDSEDDAPPSRGMRSLSQVSSAKSLSKSPATGERTAKQPKATAWNTAKLSLQVSSRQIFRTQFR